MLPWGYTTDLPEDYNEILEVSKIGVAALKKVNGLQFKLGSPANLLCKRAYFNSFILFIFGMVFF
jgi:hypothetical protein